MCNPGSSVTQPLILIKKMNDSLPALPKYIVYYYGGMSCESVLG